MQKIPSTTPHKISCNLCAQENHATSLHKKITQPLCTNKSRNLSVQKYQVTSPRKQKIPQSLSTKKIMQPLCTKNKSQTSLRTQKLRNPSAQKNSLKPFPQKNHTTSQCHLYANHSTSQHKKKSRNLSSQKNHTIYKHKKILQPLCTKKIRKPLQKINH